jgi:hypothetical protein
MGSKDDNFDELDDGFGVESDQEDSNVFKIRDMLNPPAASSFSTKTLHGQFHVSCILSILKIHGQSSSDSSRYYRSQPFIPAR